MAHDKRLETRVAILGWPRDDSETADHVTLGHEAHGAAGSGRALFGQNAIEIAVKWTRRTAVTPGAVSPGGRFGDKFSQGAFRLARRGRPIQTVLPARIAVE